MHLSSKFVRTVVMTTALGVGGFCLVAGEGGVFGPAKAEAHLQRRYPKIRAAVDIIRDAQTELKNAGHNFGGHRVKAMEALDVAR